MKKSVVNILIKIRNKNFHHENPSFSTVVTVSSSTISKYVYNIHTYIHKWHSDWKEGSEHLFADNILTYEEKPTKFTKSHWN